MALPTNEPTASLARALLACACLLVAACSDDGSQPGPGPGEPVVIALEEVADGLSSPLFLTAPPGDTQRLFVVEQGGLIRIVEGGSVLATPFLDLSGAITTTGNEQGLLGLVFHPDYSVNGYFYVDYTDGGGDTRVVRFNVSAGDPDVADAASATPILTVVQPYPNHNGGMLAFGPDGLLYIGLGDGGAGGDPQNNAQMPSTLLGSILRLDVDTGTPYAIPGDNPFLGHATYREEVWAYGLRNPWRFSFDRETGALWIADVGQNAVEEVSYQPPGSSGGENYGWNVMEGSSCYDPPSGCSGEGLTLPVYEYQHSDGCSITGGYAYRGADFPSLQGRYFLGDYCRGWIRSFRLADGEVTDIQDHTDEVGTLAGLSSFGEDATGELYVLSRGGGTVYRITAADQPAP